MGVWVAVSEGVGVIVLDSVGMANAIADGEMVLTFGIGVLVFPHEVKSQSRNIVNILKRRFFGISIIYLPLIMRDNDRCF
jgi:hypothetical protein